MEISETKKNNQKGIKVALVVIAILITITWLFLTPPGILGKADAVGYAICHRIPERSFWLTDRQMPLCARCSGMQLGALVGILYQFRHGKRGHLPPIRIASVLAVFFLAFAFDGINSTLFSLNPELALYSPNNIFRLTSGIGVGIGIAALIVPIFNQTLWQDWVNQPALNSWGELFLLMGLSLLTILVFLSELPFLLYPLALFSAINVFLLLMMVYSVLVVIITRRENQYYAIQDAWMILAAGFTLALVQIAGMDLIRYLLTGSWNGFNLS